MIFNRIFGSTFCAINVTYPSGSICTCTHTNGLVLTAGDTTGQWVFFVPYDGTWTVNCSGKKALTNEDFFDSKSIEVINSDEQNIFIELGYSLPIFKDGKFLNENIFGKWEITTNNSKVSLGQTLKLETSAKYNVEADEEYYNPKIIDMSSFKSLKFDVGDCRINGDIIDISNWYVHLSGLSSISGASELYEDDVYANLRNNKVTIIDLNRCFSSFINSKTRMHFNFSMTPNEDITEILEINSIELLT